MYFRDSFNIKNFSISQESVREIIALFAEIRNCVDKGDVNKKYDGLLLDFYNKYNETDVVDLGLLSKELKLEIDLLIRAIICGEIVQQIQIFREFFYIWRYLSLYVDVPVSVKEHLLLIMKPKIPLTLKMRRTLVEETYPTFEETVKMELGQSVGFKNKNYGKYSQNFAFEREIFSLTTSFFEKVEKTYRNHIDLLNSYQNEGENIDVLFNKILLEIKKAKMETIYLVNSHTLKDLGQHFFYLSHLTDMGKNENLAFLLRIIDLPGPEEQVKKLVIDLLVLNKVRKICSTCLNTNFFKKSLEKEQFSIAYFENEGHRAKMLFDIRRVPVHLLNRDSILLKHMSLLEEIEKLKIGKDSQQINTDKIVNLLTEIKRLEYFAFLEVKCENW